MAFRPRNAYYLRVSANIVLPLFLYLDERHIDWMSDVVLQHVLADLRPLIIPKLQAEKDVHFGPGTMPDNKRGTVEVHRGETYQFAYFFRRTEPHTVLCKSRQFVVAPPRPEVIPQRASPRPSTRLSAKQSKRKHQGHSDEDEWSAEESEEDMDDADPIPREPRPVRKQRRVTADACQADDVEDTCQDVTMDSPPPEMDPNNPSVDRGPAAWDEDDRRPDAADLKLVVEDEEEKPKPLLKLKYQSITISGHCLCIVVEPWPPLRTENRLPTGFRSSLQAGGSERSLPSSSGSSIAGQRAKTPLFLPEDDRTLGDVPYARERTIPPVPLFHDAMSRTENDDYNDDSLMTFSQSLNTAGHMHAAAADDDDDMDGAVLFGDADEVRELI